METKGSEAKSQGSLPCPPTPGFWKPSPREGPKRSLHGVGALRDALNDLTTNLHPRTPGLSQSASTKLPMDIDLLSLLPARVPLGCPGQDGGSVTR